MAGFPQQLPPGGLGQMGSPADQGTASPLSSLGSRGSSSGSLLQLIMAVLAGAGIPHVLDSVGKFMNGMKPGKNQAVPKDGGKQGAAGPPPTPNPQQLAMMLQMLAQRPPGGGQS